MTGMQIPDGCTGSGLPKRRPGASFPSGEPVADPPPAELAGAAAEAIRALNHATLDGSGYRAPSDVDATVAELESLAWRLQQTIRQAYTWLRTEHAAGRVGHDTGPGDTDTDVRGAVAWMDLAVQRAGQLGEALNEAHRFTAHLTGDLS